MRQLFVHKVSISTSRRAAALPFIGYKVVCTLFLKKFFFTFTKKFAFFFFSSLFLGFQRSGYTYMGIYKRKDFLSPHVLKEGEREGGTHISRIVTFCRDLSQFVLYMRNGKSPVGGAT